MDAPPWAITGSTSRLLSALARGGPPIHERDARSDARERQTVWGTGRSSWDENLVRGTVREVAFVGLIRKKARRCGMVPVQWLL